MKRTYRIVTAKVGLDGHDRGAKIVATALREAGFEVIYLGLRQSPRSIAAAALQEDADAVGLSVLSGAHMTLFPRVVAALAAQGAPSMVVFGGGIIPEADIAALQREGVSAIFTPGASTVDICEWLENTLDARENLLAIADDPGFGLRDPVGG